MTVENAADWHHQRRREIRQRHPEVKALVGPDPSSAFYIVALTMIQLLLATAVVGQPVWVVVLTALFVGTIPAHALGVLIHEASHNLIVRGDRANKVWSIIANLVLIGPAAIDFRHQHIEHHRRLGEGYLDTQAPPESEVRTIGAHGWKKLWSFAFGRFFFSEPRRPSTPTDGWLVANWIACVGTGLIVVWTLGWTAFAFLGLSGLLAFGPSIVGARRISEHLPAREGQPTNSYYGALNWFSFNVGYHVEHHDFPAVAWRRLPRLHRTAPEAYRRLFSLQSWTLLIVRYFTSTRYEAGHYLGLSATLPPAEAELLAWRPGDWLESDAAGSRAGPPSQDGSAAA